MTWIPKSLIALGVISGLGSLVSLGDVTTDENDSSLSEYQSISLRNPFNLRPPTPPKVEEPPPPPKAEIFLTGISTFTTPYRAFLMTREPQGETAHYALGVGDEKDGLAVLSIDEIAKSVRIRNGGVETLLTFKSHGVPPPKHAAPPPQRGAVPGIVPPGTVPRPLTRNAGNRGAGPSGAYVVNNPRSNSSSGTSSTLPLPTRNIRTQPLGNSYYGGGNSPDFAPAMQGNLNRERPVRHQFEQPDMDAVQQAILLEAQRAMNPDIPLPPTPGVPGTSFPVPPAPGQ